MTTLGIDIRARLYEVTRPQHTDVAHGLHAVGIVEPGVDDGNRHPLSPESGLVQLMAATQGNLPEGHAIHTVGMHSRTI